MLRTGRVGRQERQVDLGLKQRRELDLGLFRRFLETLQGHHVLRNVDALILLEFLNQPVDNPLVDVVAAQVRIAVGRLHLDHAVAHFEDRDVEGAAAEIVNGDRFVLLAIEPVSERRRRRFIDDAKNLEARNLTGIFRRLPLRVVKIRGHRDDGLSDLLAKI